jgi:hypothetical protein
MRVELAILGGVAAALIVYWWVGTSVRPKVALRREAARLARMTAPELVREAQRQADAAGMRARFGEAALFSRDPDWDESALAEALDELYAALAAADAEQGERGPGSWVYFFHDFGLGRVRELLRQRSQR